MKTILFNFILLFALSAGIQPIQAQSKADEDAIKAMIQEAYNAFMAKDAARFAAVFTDDCDFISPPGEHIKGKQAIEAVHTELFKAFTGGKSEMLSFYVRFLTNDIAIATWQDYQEADMGGQKVTGNALGLITVIRKNGKWLAASCQMTPVQPVPGK